MLLSLAWRNIWRNKKRSLIILISIAFGFWGGFFAGAIMMGMGESIVGSAVEGSMGHIQLHHPEFAVEKDIHNAISNGPEMVERIKEIPGVRGASGRTVIEGMASSPTSSSGIMITGIVPEDMSRAVSLPDRIVEGDFFETKYKRSIIIGQKLADTLNLGLRKKIVLSFQGLDGNIVYHACRIVGIYKTDSDQFDGLYAFLPQSELIDVLQADPPIHEIAVRVNSTADIDPVYNQLKQIYPDALTRTWKEIAPEIAVISSMIEQFSYIFVAIILLALIFGIINTMLMSVIDRIREFGMLMAVGMKKRRVFILIILESILLSITGGALGILVSIVTVGYYGSTGIDLSMFSESLSSFGMNTMLYPFLPFAMYITIAFMIIVTANLAGLFPAIKAARIVPSEALRTY